jgi:hypothetical protein
VGSDKVGRTEADPTTIKDVDEIVFLVVFQAKFK